MAHNLNINERGEAAFFNSDVKPAWHGLGKNLGRKLTAEEALKEGHLDFEVVKRPIYWEAADGEKILLPKKYATVREDRDIMLGVVGDKYTILQNKSVFSLFDPLISEGEAVYDTGGVLGDGQTVWVAMKLPAHLKVAGKDEIELYLVGTSTHDGSGSALGFLSPIRTVCQNTLKMAIGANAGMVRIRHLASAEAKLKEAHRILGISNQLAGEMEEIFNSLAGQKVTSRDEKSFIETLFPIPPVPEGQDDYKRKPSALTYREEVLEAYETGVGQQAIRGTKWGLFNGVTHWLDHGRKYNSDGGHDSSKKLSSIWFGDSARIRQDALDLLLRMN